MTKQHTYQCEWLNRPHPCDGYRIERWRSPAGQPLTAALLAGAMRDGQWQIEPLRVVAVTLPDLRQLGALRRAEWLLQSLVRYFNTGGSWEEFQSLLARLRLVIPDGRCPAGYFYCSSEITVDGDWLHQFRDQSDPERVVLWAEDWFWDKVYADPTVRRDDTFELKPAAHSAPLPTQLD